MTGIYYTHKNASENNIHKFRSIFTCF